MTEATAPVDIDAQLAVFRERFTALQQSIGTVIVGVDDLVRDCLVCIFAGGHSLLEGVPGLGKTSLVKAIGSALDLDAGRIQCTPDLMPADILGTHIVNEDEHGRRRFEFERGPVFHHILLVDEINRATPKTQSALLEVMQEGRVSVGREVLNLPKPFFLMATQNPLEMEGTYPLPEAQLDRFLFKLEVAFPPLDTLLAIARATTGSKPATITPVWTGSDIEAAQDLLTQIPIADPITRYAAQLILATHPEHPSASERVKRLIAYGASPRGLQALIRSARVHCALRDGTSVAVEDIRAVAHPCLRHRLIANFEGEAEGLRSDELIDQVLLEVPAPGSDVA